MKNATEMIREACFDLSVSLMWEKESLTADTILAHTAELNAMAEEFYKISLWHMQNIEDEARQGEIVVRIIRYIDAAHAIPPLRGNIKWFDYTLAALVELASPNAGLTKSDGKVLEDFEDGIRKYKESLHDDNEGFH